MRCVTGPARLGAAFGTRSIAPRAWSVPSARSVPAGAGATRRPRAETTAPAHPALTERAARAGRGRADDDAAVGLHAHRLGLQALLALDREVNDAALVGEHRFERHGLAARAHTRCDTLRDLAELVLASAPVPFDVHRDVH